MIICKKIYVSGKITGVKEFGYRYAFGYAASRLKELGYQVINPVLLNDDIARQGFSYEDMMHLCFAAIDLCDAVYMLPGWEASPGAQREHDYACKTGRYVMCDYETAERMKRLNERGMDNNAISEADERMVQAEH